MNYYLLFLSLYSLCILPLRIRLELRLGKRLGYCLRIRVIGVRLEELRLRLFGSRKETDEKDRTEGEPQEHDVTQALFQMDLALIRCLLSPGFWRTVFRLTQWQRVSIRVRIAMEDAAATALSYTALSIFMEGLKRIDTRLSAVDAKVETDFSGKGSQAVVIGILSVRLGSIALVALRFLREYQRRRSAMRSEETMKEEEYATASHR